ncbi:MAG: alpha/beta fold hydrolase [Gemmatimonadota bacterium]|nr:alpha/beta fold hydrolase [Gemmatimonadota bacterium]
MTTRAIAHSGEGTVRNDDTFRPFPGLGNPHAQTIAARLRRARMGSRYERSRIDTDDGDFLDIDVRELDVKPRAACLLLHGLEGCAESGYMLATAEALAARDILPVALNFRSCGGTPNRTLGSYHSGRTDDIRRALAWIDDAYPGLRRLAVGFSLGGNALLVHLGSTGPASGIAAAVAVSVPYELARCADALERGLGRAYGAYFLRSLVSKLGEKARRFPGRVSERALRAKTVREFDDAFTAPVHGFDGAADYYERCSASRFVEGVRVPTLLLQSVDDPLVPSTSIPSELIAANPALEPQLTDRGGHVGYLARGDGGDAPGWMERRIADYLAVRARELREA